MSGRRVLVVAAGAALLFNFNASSDSAIQAQAIQAPPSEAQGASGQRGPFGRRSRARNVIFFVGDGRGVSTVTAARIFSVGTDGDLVLDQMPYTALSRTANTDHITADSGGSMTSMMTGVNTNQGVLGFDPSTERQDFNGDGDGRRLPTVLELVERSGMTVGVVTTARATHATLAATHAHINERNDEDDIAFQLLPADPAYNRRLGDGLDLLLGGGRRHFVPAGVSDEEGESGSRGDGHDLRAEFQDAGYAYVWNDSQLAGVEAGDLPLLGLFERSHMEYEVDRPTDLGGEPSLTDMTLKAIDLLENAGREWWFVRNPVDGRRATGLMVEHGEEIILEHSDSDLARRHVADGSGSASLTTRWWTSATGWRSTTGDGGCHPPPHRYTGRNSS